MNAPDLQYAERARDLHERRRDAVGVRLPVVVAVGDRDVPSVRSEEECADAEYWRWYGVD